MPTVQASGQSEYKSKSLQVQSGFLARREMEGTSVLSASFWPVRPALPEPMHLGMLIERIAN